MNKFVIIVFGNAGHGKDTFSDMLRDSIGELFWQDAQSKGESRAWKSKEHFINFMIERTAFADEVKRTGVFLVGIPWKISKGTQEDKETWTKYGRTGREWLQWIGTDLGRDMIDRNIWVHRLADSIKNNEGTRLSIVSDGRFLNELNVEEHLPEEYNVINIRIKRADVPVKYGHQSETELTTMQDSLFHYVVHNDGNLEQLKTNSSEIAIELLKQFPQEISYG